MHRVRPSVASLANHQCGSSRSSIESMERRRFLSVAVSGGVLTITGTGGDDVYAIGRAGDANAPMLTVSENGASQSFAYNSVNSIVANLGGGNDSITFATAITKPTHVRGEAGNDTIAGGSANDSIEGGDGNDSISGFSGNDTLRGDAGDDVLVPVAGNNVLDGGAGSDSASYFALREPVLANIRVTYTRDDETQPPVVTLTGGGSTSQGTSTYLNIETIIGGIGDDTLSAGTDRWSDSQFDPQAPSLRIDGSEGNDSLTVFDGESDFTIGDTQIVAEGGAGDDHFEVIGTTKAFATLIGGEGNDYFVVKNSEDSANVRAGAGYDTLEFRTSESPYRMPSGLNKVIALSGGNIIGNDADNIIEGDAFSAGSIFDGAGGNDTIIMSGHGTLIGGDGDDILRGLSSDDDHTFDAGRFTADGGSGNDTILLNEGANPENASGGSTVFGGDGDDSITVIGGDDDINGGNGNDTVFAGVGDDRIDGDAGDDRLNGEGGKDTIRGGDGDDRIYGNSGSDRLYGDAGVDRLYGGNKNDYLEGGAGGDYLKGDEDTDTAKKDKKDRRSESIEIFV